MFRILAIDGGGMKGVFAAAFLDQIQSCVPYPIASYFDLIAGTSTGGILSLALGTGIHTSEIVKLYLTEGRRIFPQERFPWWLKLRGTFYKPDGLRAVLEGHFGEKRLGEATSRLLIPSLQAHTGHVHIYKNAYHARLRNDYKEKIVEVALATSAAPIYFPMHHSQSGLALLDGGLWANNPAGIATAEAVGLLRVPCEEIRLLTVGTTDTPVGKIPAAFRPIKRGKYALAVAMAAQSSGALGVAKTLIGGESVFRQNITLGGGLARLDQIDDLTVLEGLGRAEGRKASTRLEQHFFYAPTDPFVPVYEL